MLINKDEFYKSMDVHKYTISSCAQIMGISREFLTYVLKGERKPGYKFISGIQKAFPGESIDKFLIKF